MGLSDLLEVEEGAAERRKNQKAESYAEKQIRLTREYIDLELGVIESIKSYETGSKLLKQLPDRAMLVIHAHMPADKPNDKTNRRLYTLEVAHYLEGKGENYERSWDRGSFYEDIGGVLKGIARNVERIQL